MSLKILPWVALVAWVAHSIQIPATPPNEYETKAGYLLNFVEFVEWPSGTFADAQAPITVGVMGKDPFGAELDKLQGKVVHGRKLQIKRFKGAMEFRGEETPGRRQDGLLLRQSQKLVELKSCHILFISSSEKKHVPLILKPLKGASVLTVSETDGFADGGGVINFLEDGKRVQIEINLDAAERARLKISSKLLSLARIIKNDPSYEKE
jgi:YfiR/HmsC-like